jgi:hypothetical protein
MSTEKLCAETLIHDGSGADEGLQQNCVLPRNCIYCFTCCDFDFEPRNCCGVSGSDNAGRCIWCGIEYPKFISETICSILCNVDCVCFQFECLNPFLLTGCPCFLLFLSSCFRSVKYRIRTGQFLLC